MAMTLLSLQPTVSSWNSIIFAGLAKQLLHDSFHDAYERWCFRERTMTAASRHIQMVEDGLASPLESYLAMDTIRRSEIETTRTRSSPLGVVFTQLYKETVPSAVVYLDKYALRMYQRNYENLAPEEQENVSPLHK